MPSNKESSDSHSRVTNPIEKISTVQFRSRDYIHEFSAGQRYEKQWQRVTEIIRREMLINPDVRRALLPFIAKPVSETLAGECVGELTPFIARLQKEFGKAPSLSRFLHSEPTSSDKVPIDLKQSIIEHLITFEQAKTISQRLRFARDIKLLSLGAELASYPISDTAAGDICKLPSGTRVHVSETFSNARKIFYHPEQWKRRRQVHDRVYEITVGDDHYILKEQKTKWHERTLETGHVQGLTSGQEFGIASLLLQASSNMQDLRVPIALSWEKPIGYAVFPDPDQYQCVLFGYEQGLITDDDKGISSAEFALPILYDEMRDHPNEWKPYYEPYEKDYSYQDFCFSYSLWCLEEAEDRMHICALKTNNGIELSDSSFGYRIRSQPSPCVEILGYDLEYASIITRPSIAQSIRERIDKKTHSRLQYGPHIGFRDKRFSILSSEQRELYKKLILEKAPFNPPSYEASS